MHPRRDQRRPLPGGRPLPPQHVATRLVTAEERDAAVGRLTAAFADDVLPVAEFERRVSAVWRVATAGELLSLTRDLPTVQEATSVADSRDGSASVAPRSSTAPRRLNSIMSSVERRIHGPMPERLRVQATMGSVELDLRDAEFPPGVTEIRVKALMGSVEIDLPPHVVVDDRGRAFMGSFTVSGSGRLRASDADAPIVRISGHAMLASIEVEIDD
ncbi:DUF1707 domain-containing protein [Gemmatimonadota bacterium Y43]|uniref:DUF1707 SHOCT-like domain-containing protein n=1 Tax=Gaopeijia maritima TaxID=3119007 RepID=UPI003278B1DF